MNLDKLASLIKKGNFGLLLMRVMLGVCMVMHGMPKMAGGSDTFEALGRAMEVFGVTYFPVFWGFLAALAETLGGVLIIIGYQFRLAAFFIAMVMLVACLYDYNPEKVFQSISYPLELFSVFIALVFIGPGKFSIDRE